MHHIAPIWLNAPENTSTRNDLQLGEGGLGGTTAVQCSPLIKRVSVLRDDVQPLIQNIWKGFAAVLLITYCLKID